VNGLQPSHTIAAVEDIKRSMRECRRWADNADREASELEEKARDHRNAARAYRAKADDFEAILDKVREP